MRASTNTLSAADQERLDTFAVEIAEDLLGPARDEGEGSWRVGALVIHPGALFYDFRLGSGGRGAIDLIKHLHRIDAVVAVDFARKWLAEHGAEGRLAATVVNSETAAKSEITPRAPRKFKRCSSGAARAGGRRLSCISPAAACRRTIALSAGSSRHGLALAAR